MSQSIRFLGLAVFAWAGVRAVSLGMVPGAEALAFDAVSSRPASPAVTPTTLPPIEPASAAAPPSPYPVYPTAYPPYAAYGAYPPYPTPRPYPVYIPVASGGRTMPVPVEYAATEPVPTHPYFESTQPIDQWMDPALAAAPVGHQSTPSFRTDRVRLPGQLDRLSLSTWAMMRDKPGPRGLADGGQLGGSQAGMRILYRFDPRLAASLRASAPVGSQRGGEAALGLRYQPLASIPVAVTAERRQAFGKYSDGRNAFALFAEGGLYARPMPWDSSLDAYLQTGIVGVKSRDWFVDGSAAVTRPVWRNVSAGFGVWGGAQPGLSRFDVGPRVSMRVRRSMRVHLDYRHKLVGNAEPGSGAVVTLAGDF